MKHSSLTISKRTRNDSDFEKIGSTADIHGFYMDKDAVSCVIQVASESKFDKWFIHGDLLDFPWLMEPGKHKFSTEDDHVTVDEEIDIAVEYFLKPLRKALGKTTEIYFKPGNHEARFLQPNANNAVGLREMVMAGMKRDRMKLESMLRFDELKIVMDRGVKQDNRFTDTTVIQSKHMRDPGVIIHGDLTGKTCLKRYLERYGCSGMSGHTHTMRKEVVHTFWGSREWIETGCLCRKIGVEYYPLGRPTNWSHGFATCWRNRYSGELFMKQHEIRDYELEYKGHIYTPVSYA